MGRNRETVVSYLGEAINPDLAYPDNLRDARQGLTWDDPLFPGWEAMAHEACQSIMWGTVAAFPAAISPVCRQPVTG